MNVMLASWLGGPQVILILAIVIILFGAKKIPELARGVGLGIKEFKKASKEVTDEINNAAHETPPAPVPTPAVPANTTAQTQAKPAETKAS
jgi:sec-independent protein translocase protein TatA